MPRVSNPITISQHFGLKREDILNAGALDVTMAMDTRLFIDPLLLSLSAQAEIKAASNTYRNRFESIIKLLGTSTVHGDVAWRGAIRLMQFHEVPATCLGYGKAGVSGSGFGPELIGHLAATGKEIVDLGINDPDIFSLLALFEEGIGADRISDMTTSVILRELVKFTERLSGKLGIPTVLQTLGQEMIDGNLPINPFGTKPAPLLLVPHDVLRPLPVAADRSEICDAAQKNQILRARVNQHIGAIWTMHSRKDKARFRQQLLASASAFNTLLEAYHSVNAAPYDSSSDPRGLHRWAEDARQAAVSNPISLRLLTEDDASGVVSHIIKQFKFLIEDRGLWKNLYSKGKPHNEHYSQGLFFAIAHSYCKANNLDISPEVDTGSGRIDFKFSSGYSTRVNVEIKLSTNSSLIDGYTKQIERYNQVEQTQGGFYVVIDVGRMGRKDKGLIEAKNDAAKKKQKLTEIVFVDATRKATASKL